MPARVIVSTDLLWKFKDGVNKRKKQNEINNLSTQNISAITEVHDTTQQGRSDRIAVLKELLEATDSLYMRLKGEGYLSGHQHNLEKL